MNRATSVITATDSDEEDAAVIASLHVHRQMQMAMVPVYLLARARLDRIALLLNPGVHIIPISAIPVHRSRSKSFSSFRMLRVQRAPMPFAI